MVPVSGLEYSTDTLFTIEIETRLTGTSGEYSGYTETEEDFRAYSITSANENQVYFNYLSDYSYRDNDGGSYDAITENKFTIDPRDNSYIGGGDGDDDNHTCLRS